MTLPPLVDAEAGSYIEEDPEAWQAFCLALHRYHDYLPSLKERFGEDAIKIVAGSMLAFMADQHRVFVESCPTDDEARHPLCTKRPG